MKTSQHNRLIFASLILFFLFFSCKQTQEVIDKLLTFDIDKSVDLPLPTATPAGIYFSLPIPIGLDSADLAKNKTGLHLVKSLRLTKLIFTPDDPSYPMSNVDTLSIAVGVDSLSTVLLATWSGAQNKVALTNADFSSQAKNPNDKFFVTFKLKKAPDHDIHVKTDYTLSITADPL
jgi:hypothetical protein